MSGYYNSPNPDDLDDDRNNGGGGLRKVLEDVLEENKKLRKLVEGDRREQTVAELLKGVGLDPAVAELIPSEADPVKWLDEKGHLLGIKKQEAANQSAPESKVQVATDDDPALIAEREALAAMNDAAESGQTATVSNDLIEKMDSFNSEAELLQFFKENGGLTV